MNPFVYGEEVAGENFCNRFDEIKDLVSEIENFQNILIYSPRRFGKTSLIKEVFKKLEKRGFLAIYIDLYPVISEKDFAQIALKAISRKIGGGRGNVLERIKDYFKTISPSLFLTLSEDGTPSVGINLAKTDLVPALDDLFNGLYLFTTAKNRPAVVVFDEFQQVGELEDNRIEKILRGIIQVQRRISYVFMGSKKHLIHDMFANPERPFYKSTRHFPLKTIEQRVFADFIQKKFAASGIRLDKTVPTAIVDAAGCHPYYTQMLAHVVWEITFEKKSADTVDVQAAIERIIEREEAVFNNVWDNLTLKQRRLLAALCFKQDDEKIYSVDFINKFDLGSVGTVQRGLASLLHKGIIDKEGEEIVISDVFLRRWLQHRMKP